MPKPIDHRTVRGDQDTAPLRTWTEVMWEFNKRHPDEPLSNEAACRTAGTRAMDKLRRKLSAAGLER